MLNDLRMLVRYAGGLWRYLDSTLTLEESKALIVGLLARRQENFLGFVRRSIFDNPVSPYLALFRHAGIEYGDVVDLVGREGLDAALEKLLDVGVFIGLDEFKGRQPIRRPGLEIAVRAEDFDNPVIKKHLEATTGGSRGTPRRLAIDLDKYEIDSAAHHLFMHDAGALDRPMGVWRSVLPDNSGINKWFHQVKIGCDVEKWFSPYPLRYRPKELKYALFTHFTHFTAALRGKKFPMPEHVPLGEAVVVAGWLAEKKAAGRPAYLDTKSSSAVRVCQAALDHRLDIAGTLFRVGSEPFTEAKARVLQATGVRVLVHYAMSECGRIGMGCTRPEQVDDVHFMAYRLAMVQRPQRVGGGDETVNSFYVTNLLPYAPKVSLNVQTGDYGVVTKRRCGCVFDRLGFDTHIHTIRSYEKLTGGGVTFFGSELITLLEEILPARFGGSVSDYQLVEEETNGVIRVSLVVSPRVGLLDESAVAEEALKFLALRNAGGRLMTAEWRHGNTLKVVRREPYATSSAKIQPLHVVGASTRS